MIDARGAGPLPGLDLAWQKFVGLTYRFDRPHGVERPVIMDACVAQDDGYRFVYSLPFSEHRDAGRGYLLLGLARPRRADGARPGRKPSCAARGLEPAEIVGQEAGVLPVLLGGELDDLWRAGGPPVARLGLRGGFFHPTTGYSLPDAVRNALAAPRAAGADRAALCTASSAGARRRFGSSGASTSGSTGCCSGPPSRTQRYRVLEHFYRLPEPLIARFYAGRLDRAGQAQDPERPSAGAGRPRDDGAAGAPGMSRSAAVIGSGFGGLALAIRLQSAGIATTDRRGPGQARRPRLFLGEGRARLRRRPDRHHRPRLPSRTMGAERRRHGRRRRAPAGLAFLPPVLARRDRSSTISTTTPGSPSRSPRSSPPTSRAIAASSTIRPGSSSRAMRSSARCRSSISARC